MNHKDLICEAKALVIPHSKFLYRKAELIRRCGNAVCTGGHARQALDLEAYRSCLKEDARGAYRGGADLGSGEDEDREGTRDKS